ncbi:3'-5' exonuclease [uncultured Flavobacterium sp.]|uniref:3'-5' exonuclease n=1 Tax=uncultured Flavobacterium sp. TaxID=165435 RepID=UPI0025D3F1C1|nr:3'-5' exonuclease [uncultured Flavobacterium sp.]
MAFDWLTGGSAPQFWKNYLALFDGDDKGQRRYVVFDMEASGLDWKEDVILSIGAIGVTGNAIQVGDFMQVFVQQDEFSKQSVALSGGVVKPPKNEKFVEAEAMIQFLNFAKDATLVGHNVNLDIEMINQALKRLDLGRLKNPVMDTNTLFQRWKDLPEDSHATLDELCDALKINKSDRHTAAGNAYTTALVFLKLKRKLGL